MVRATKETALMFQFRVFLPLMGWLMGKERGDSLVTFRVTDLLPPIASGHCLWEQQHYWAKVIATKMLTTTTLTTARSDLCANHLLSASQHHTTDVCRAPVCCPIRRSTPGP